MIKVASTFLISLDKKNLPELKNYLQKNCVEYSFQKPYLVPELREFQLQEDGYTFSDIKDADSIFAILSLPADSRNLLEKFCYQGNVAIEKIDWPEAIVQWQPNPNLVGFKKMIEKNYWPEQTQSDPTAPFAFWLTFWMAIIVHDIFGGFVMILLSQILPRFIKDANTKQVFKVLFLPGIIAVMIGLLGGSLAGNLGNLVSSIFGFGNFWEFLKENFRIIDWNGLNDNLLLNKLVGSSLTISTLILGFFGIFAFVNIISGIIKNLSHSVKIGRFDFFWTDFVGFCAWISLLVSCFFWLKGNLLILPISVVLFTTYLFLLKANKGAKWSVVNFVRNYFRLGLSGFYLLLAYIFELIYQNLDKLYIWIFKLLGNPFLSSILSTALAFFGLTIIIVPSFIFLSTLLKDIYLSQFLGNNSNRLNKN